MFTGVYKKYQEIDPDGSIKELNEYLAGILECKPEEVYEEIEVLLNHLIPKKALHEYGVKRRVGRIHRSCYDETGKINGE